MNFDVEKAEQYYNAAKKLHEFMWAVIKELDYIDPGEDEINFNIDDVLTLTLAELSLRQKRIAALEAARIAYASEFPADGEGNPDVGSIHENIRALKARYEELSVRDRLQEFIKKTVSDGKCCCSSNKGGSAATVVAADGIFNSGDLEEK